MNKKIGFILALVLVSLLVVGTASAGLFDFLGGGSSNNATANNDTTLIVGFDAEFPPYGFKDANGSYTGFDLDLAKEVSNRNNWTFKAQPIDWDAKDAELDSGSIDCIWNGFTINGREDKYTWSSPYVDNSQVFVVADGSDIAEFSDLAGKAVGVQRDSSALSALNNEEEPDNIALRDSFEVAKSLGIKIERTKICGGGAKSPLWRRIIANVLNIKIDRIFEKHRQKIVDILQ